MICPSQDLLSESTKNYLWCCHALIIPNWANSAGSKTCARQPNISNESTSYHGRVSCAQQISLSSSSLMVTKLCLSWSCSLIAIYMILNCIAYKTIRLIDIWKLQLKREGLLKGARRRPDILSYWLWRDKSRLQNRTLHVADNSAEPRWGRTNRIRIPWTR